MAKLSQLYPNPNKTHQGTRARADQVRNSAGGYSFQVNEWDLLDRFLVLGSEGGTFYITPQQLTKTACTNLRQLIKRDGITVINRIVEISTSGRAARNDPALFALAMCIAEGDEATRTYAYNQLHKVARIGTHLFTLAENLKAMEKGWGKGLRKAIGRWYTNKNVDQLQLTAIKYKQREGWSHRDLLRLAHPTAETASQNHVFHYMVNGELPKGARLPQIRAHASLTDDSKVAAVIDAIERFRLPREGIPTKFLNNIEVWDALLTEMPPIALVRNLGKMTNIGLLKPGAAATSKVVEKLGDKDAIKRSRLHPMQVLFALKIYGNGKGMKGSLSWSPVQSIVDELDELFYTSFGNVEPMNKRTCLGIDVSGSMGRAINNSGWTHPFQGAGGPISCAEGAAAMAMVTARVEQRDSYAFMGFSHEFVDLGISPRQRLDDVVARVRNRNFGGTDCSLPMTWALKEDLQFDTFCVYTDDETWYGDMHPFEAIRKYRQKTGIPAKLVVTSMTGNQFTIADPSDAGMMDVVGFDAGAPAIISDFARAEMR
jgi:60 kDa SS-A/Ro ribonucleoprotein